MVHIKKIKLNQKGFGHHVLIPVLVIALVAAIGVNVFLHSRAATPSTAPTYTYHVGDFGITPGSGTLLDTANLQANLNDFSNLGARWIRSTIPWKSFVCQSTTKGCTNGYNFSKVDAFTSILNNSQNIGKYRIIATIEGPPSWSKPTTITGCTDNQVPFDLDQYATDAAQLAGHLKGQNVHVFEIENSPNIGAHTVSSGTDTRGLWTHANPCAYAQLLKKTYDKIHAVRPDAVVLVGGIGGTGTQLDSADHNLPIKMPADDFLAGIYASPDGKACGGHSCFDGVAYHAYSWPDAPCSATPHLSNSCAAIDSTVNPKGPNGPGNGWDRMVNAYANIMSKNGDSGMRVWVTEYGFPGGVPGSSQYSLSAQAADITTAFQQASTLKWLGPLSIFTLKDGTDTDHTYSIYMGLRNESGNQKPSYNAYQALTAPFRAHPPSTSDSDTSEF